MKTASIIAALAGVAVITALVIAFGAGAVTRSLLSFGWDGFAAVFLIQLGLIATMGVAWRGLVAGSPTWAFIWARFVRDAAAEVLPLSPVAGYAFGARALTLAGVSVATAAASAIVDLTLEFFAKLAYTGLGLAWLIHLRPNSPFAWPLTAGLAVASLVAAAFLFIQRRGPGPVGRLAGRRWAERAAAAAKALRTALLLVHRRRIGLWSGFLLHLACWIAGTCEAWIALRCADRTLPFGEVLVIESLLYAIRTIAFVIPNAVGVQEGAYILVGTAFGLSPEMALALSLLKRARDLAIGLPVIGVWQIVEGGQLWRRSRHRPAKSFCSERRKTT
jgi:glycosyltransferase 2 family protein